MVTLVSDFLLIGVEGILFNGKNLLPEGSKFLPFKSRPLSEGEALFSQ